MNKKTENKLSNDETEITLKESERTPCEVWTRVMGYHRPASSFNVGKKGEFRERIYFREIGAQGSGRHMKPV